MAYNILKGAMVNTTLPAFSAYVNTTITEVTGDGTAYTIIFDTELFDQSNNFSLVTGLFTAPVTGRYSFAGYCRVIGGTSIGAGGAVLSIVTTANTFRAQPQLPAASTALGQEISVICPMTAGDTAGLVIQITDTGGKVDDVAGVTGGQIRTWFSGSLVC